MNADYNLGIAPELVCVTCALCGDRADTVIGGTALCYPCSERDCRCDGCHGIFDPAALALVEVDDSDESVGYVNSVWVELCPRCKPL